MTNEIRVVIADDHKLMLDSLAQALDSVPDIRVVATVTDGADLADAVARTNPDVLLVDVEMPGQSGLSAISRIDHLPATLIVSQRRSAPSTMAWTCSSTPLRSWRATPGRHSSRGPRP